MNGRDAFRERAVGERAVGERALGERALGDTTVRDLALRLIDRDLTAMQQEVAAYPTDDAMWVIPPGIANCGGTLALHVAGNLRHFIGAMLGGTGFVRDRSFEFSATGLTREYVMGELADAQAQVMRTLRALDPARLDDEFPQLIHETRLPTRMFLLHLATHLSYHLGQVDYHRRLTTGLGTTVASINIPALVRPFPEPAVS